MIVKVVNKIQPYDDNYNLSIFFLPNHDNYFILLTDSFLKKSLDKMFFCSYGISHALYDNKALLCMSDKGGVHYEIN